MAKGVTNRNLQDMPFTKSWDLWPLFWFLLKHNAHKQERRFVILRTVAQQSMLLYNLAFSPLGSYGTLLTSDRINELHLPGGCRICLKGAGNTGLRPHPSPRDGCGVRVSSFPGTEVVLRPRPGREDGGSLHYDRPTAEGQGPAVPEGSPGSRHATVLLKAYIRLSEELGLGSQLGFIQIQF